MNRARLLSAIISLLSLPATSISAAAGTLSFFLNYSCRQASTVNPTVQIAANTCLATLSARGVSVKVAPPCLTGRAELAIYRDASCTTAFDSPDSMIEDNCYYPNIMGVIQAVQFVCPEVESGSEPTATTTATFGSTLIPVASNEAASSSQPKSATPSKNTAIPIPESNASPTFAISSPTDRNPTASPQSSNVNDDGDGASKSGISRNAQIGIGIGVPVAALLVAILAWWFPCKKARRFGKGPHNAMGEVASTGPSPPGNWAPHSSAL